MFLFPYISISLLISASPYYISTSLHLYLLVTFLFPYISTFPYISVSLLYFYLLTPLSPYYISISLYPYLRHTHTHTPTHTPTHTHTCTRTQVPPPTLTGTRDYWLRPRKATEKTSVWRWARALPLTRGKGAPAAPHCTWHPREGTRPRAQCC